MNRKVALIAGGVAVALTALWFFLLFSPQSDRLGEARDREELAVGEVSRLQVELARRQAMVERKTQMEADLASLKVAVPESPMLAQFIMDANQAALDSGIDFLTISPATPAEATAPGMPASVGLAFTIEGGYFQVLDYMNRLADMHRIVVVDSVNLSPQGEEVAPRLSVTLSARMFTTSAAIQPVAPDVEAVTDTTETPAPAPATTNPEETDGAVLGATTTEVDQ